MVEIAGISSSLTGFLLVSNPAAAASESGKKVIYICSDDENGTMGLVVNNPIKNMDIEGVLDQLGMQMEGGINSSIQVLTGGPIEASRGFVLHSNDTSYNGTLNLKEDLYLTATLDVLENIAKGAGPKEAAFCLGYTGWEKGRLYQEFLQDRWLICPKWKEVLFSNVSGEEKWRIALTNSGVQSPQNLMSISSRTH